MLRLEDTWRRKEINARPAEQEGEEEGAQTSASSEFRNRLRRRKEMDNGVERTVGCLRRNNEENDLSGHVLLG